MTCRPCVKAASAATGLALAAAAVLWAMPARAADMPEDDTFLRGTLAPAELPRWDGIVFGAQFGLMNMNTDFGNGTSSMVAYMLRNTTIENEGHVSEWTTLPSNTTNSRSYGIFLGYNVQWGELVVGIDGAYNHPSTLEASATDSINRRFTTTDGYENNVTVSAASSLKLIDYATLRARAGYAFGQFLPYAVLGAAVGRFNYTTSATTTASGTDISGGGGSPYGPTTQSQTESRNNSIVGGFVAGLGMDVALLPNVFLRGEWEFVAFAPVHGLRANINTARVGIGLKF